MRELKLIVGGESVSGSVQQIVSPHTGVPVSEVHFAQPDHLEQAVAIANDKRSVMARLPWHQRAAILTKTAELLVNRETVLAQAICEEAAKPWRLAVLEAQRCVDTFLNAAEECRRYAEGYGVGLDGVPAGDGRYGVVRRFAVGPVLAISPFNFPLNLSAHKLAPAIAAGCPIVLKPASQTPSAALLLAEAVLEAGLPPSAISVIPATREVADSLIDDERFRLVSFTGSPEVGWTLKKRSGKKKVILELGGNAAALVDEDADLNTVIPRLASGAFAYAGQVCISVQRIYVADKIYNKFLEQFVDYTKTHVKCGPPDDEAAILSSMIDEANASRIMDWINKAEKKKAKVWCGKRRAQNLIFPTVLSDVALELPINAQEAFGPVVTIAPFSNWEQAVSLVNHSRYGLQASVFTNDIRAAWYCFEAIEVGAVIHNDYPAYRVDMMPYGGIKDSGFGREGPRWSIAEMTEERLLVLNPR